MDTAAGKCDLILRRLLVNDRLGFGEGKRKPDLRNCTEGCELVRVMRGATLGEQTIVAGERAHGFLPYLISTPYSSCSFYTLGCFWFWNGISLVGLRKSLRSESLGH